MKTKDLLKQMTEKEQEALFEMIDRLHNSNITDWTFKLFLDGLVSTLEDRSK